MVSYTVEQCDISANRSIPAVYLVGSHPNSPQNPHSAPASGGTSLANLRTDPPVNERVLYGAMVGGPLSNDRYWDWRDDWVQNEVALDYNTMIPTLAAMQVSCLIRWASDSKLTISGCSS